MNEYLYFLYVVLHKYVINISSVQTLEGWSPHSLLYSYTYERPHTLPYTYVHVDL